MSESETTTEAGFYTALDNHGENPVTFCASCALANTNPAFVMAGLEPAQSMAEATVILHVVLAFQGLDPDEALVYREHGSCELCGKEG